MKFIMMLDTPIWIIIVVCLIFYIASLRKRIAGFNDPVLYLSKGERRAWARKELAQRDEDKDLAQFERNLGIVQGNPTHKESM